MLMASQPEWPSWCWSQLAVVGLQFCGLLFCDPTYCTLSASPAAASWSHTSARQQVISVILSPRGTGRCQQWSLLGDALRVHLLILSFWAVCLSATCTGPATAKLARPRTERRLETCMATIFRRGRIHSGSLLAGSGTPSRRSGPTSSFLCHSGAAMALPVPGSPSGISPATLRNLRSEWYVRLW